MLALKNKFLSVLFAVFSTVYLLQSLLTEPDKASLAKYHISSGQAVGLLLTIAIPYVVIWLVALGGYLRLQDYVQSIIKGKDGAAFAVIAKGILLLTLWLPLSAILANFLSRYYHVHPAATANAVRLDNYANLAILLPAFWLINHGAHKLLKVAKQPSYQFPQKIVIAFISLSALYVLIALSDPAREAPTQAVAAATYYLPDWAIVTTIIIPRLIMWFLGIQAIYLMYLYRQKIKGALYRDALKSLSQGLAWVIGTTIVLRLFQSVSTQLVNFNLGAILLILYGLLTIIAIGYSLIAKGAKSLQHIEEI